MGTPLLPADAKLRAHCRLWADHVRYLDAPASTALLTDFRSTVTLFPHFIELFKSKINRSRWRISKSFELLSTN